MMSLFAEHPCEPFHPELTRLACGDAAQPTPAFRAHLARCPTCQAALTDMQSLVGDLRVALEPSELPATLISAIEHRLTCTPARRRGRWLSLVVPCAMAASVALALLIPFRLHIARNSPAGPGATAQAGVDDAAWDSPSGYSLGTLTAVASGSEAARELTTDEWTLLPWGSEDDWDIPGRDTEAGQNEG